MIRAQHAVKILLFQDSDFDHVAIRNILMRSGHAALDVQVRSPARLEAHIDAEVSALILEDDEAGQRTRLILEVLGKKSLNIPVLVIADYYDETLTLDYFTQGVVGYLAKHEISRIPKLLKDMQTYLAGTRYRDNDLQALHHH
jgi:DNA-binding NarL/FixJ family response regulator